MDLIRRSDAIDAIENTDWYHQNRNKDMVSGANSDEHQAWYKADDVYNALGAVPSAVEWIPCSERLPSKQGFYLTSFPLMNDRMWVDTLWYGKPMFSEDDKLCFYVSDSEFGDVEYDDVIAWMPLPSPYGESEAEDD